AELAVDVDDRTRRARVDAAAIVEVDGAGVDVGARAGNGAVDRHGRAAAAAVLAENGDAARRLEQRAGGGGQVVADLQQHRAGGTDQAVGAAGVDQVEVLAAAWQVRH